MPNVKVRLYGKKRPEVIVEGRLLGLVTPEVYNGALKLSNAGRKLFNGQSVTMTELSQATKIEGSRLAITAKKVDGEEVTGKKILFTEPLEYINEIQKNKEHVWMQSMAGNTIIVNKLQDTED